MESAVNNTPPGAQPGNTNALRTGRRSSRPGTVLARLGPKYSQPYQDVCRLRRGVESLLRGKHGALSLLQAARLQSLCRLELNCRIAELTIRDRPDMPTESLRSFRESIGRWTRERDNALEALVGGVLASSVPGVAALYAAPVASDGILAEKDTPAMPDASGEAQ